MTNTNPTPTGIQPPEVHALPDGRYEVQWSTERKSDQSERFDTLKEAEKRAKYRRARMNADQKYRRTNVEPGIQKRVGADGKDIFEISFRDTDGNQRHRVVKPATLTAARAALRAELVKRDRGERVSADPRLTFTQAADQWWDMRASNLRRNTQSAYKSNLNHLRPTFGRKRLQAITAAEVARYKKTAEASYKGWTIKGDLNVLSAVFKHAARHLGFTGQNPVTALDRQERPSTKDQKPKRVLKPEEVERLLANIPDRYRLVFELAEGTGARLGEALGLVWGEVDLDAETVTFTHQLDRRTRQREELKTDRSRRTIEVDPVLVTKLRKAKMAARDKGDHAFVFVARTGAPHDHRNIKRVMDRAVKGAGVEAVERSGKVVESAPTFHSLRHSHGSALIASGEWDIEEVSARLGHADVSTTMRVYVHEYDQARRGQSRKDRLAAMYAKRRGGQGGGEVVGLPGR